MMNARISPDGAVESNHVFVQDGLSDEVAACLLDVLRGASFSPPGGGGSTLMVPVTFVQDDK